jgi:hypothetical protein
MTDRCRFAGFLKTGSVERSDDSGSGRTPLICAASIAMAAAARSCPSSFSAIIPPNEWPISTGLAGRPPIISA